VLTSPLAGPFGLVQSGCLTLRSILIPDTLKHLCSCHHIKELYVTGVAFPDDDFFNEYRQQVSIIIDNAAEYSKGPEISPAFLAAFSPFQFLILERTGGGKGEFRRFGILRSMNGTSFQDFLGLLCMIPVSQPIQRNDEDEDEDDSEWEDEDMSEWEKGNARQFDDLIEYLSSVPNCIVLRKLEEENYLEFDMNSRYYTHKIIAIFAESVPRWHVQRPALR
jgi:hypothetical protein